MRSLRHSVRGSGFCLLSTMVGFGSFLGLVEFACERADICDSEQPVREHGHKDIESDESEQESKVSFEPS
jgi:hypothetical protein